METYLHKLQGAIDFIRRLFEDQQISLDYSPQSIQHLDALFDSEFYKGELINKSGTFAQYQGLIMTGVSGYMAQVILRNTDHAKLIFEQDDENWFINFSLEAGNGWKILPGHKVLKRAYNGDADQLYAFTVSAVSYLNSPESTNKPAVPFNYLMDGLLHVFGKQEKGMHN